MDPLSLTTGIITLYGTCMKIFVFFTDVNNADKTAAKALRTLEIRSSALKSWGHYWEIQGNSGSSQKLKNYIDKNVSKGNAVQLSLEAIADTLSDREKLLKSFGVKVDPKGLDVKVDTRKRSPGRTPSPSRRNSEKWKFEKFTLRLNILSRCRWALGRNADIDGLNLELRSHTDILYQLCPEDAISAMQMIFAEERLRIAVTLEALGQLASRFAAQPPVAFQQLCYSPSDGGLELLEHLTDLNLKAQVARRASLTEVQRQRLLTMDEKDFEIRTPRGASDVEWSLAMWSPKKEIVYIEFKSYNDDRGYKSKDIQEDVLKLSILFSDPRTPVRLRTLRPLGIFKNPNHGYLGFAYALPDLIWRTPPTMTESEWDIRRPHRLNKALEFRNISHAPLGLRFELARTLLKSVIFFHTSGWLHKNIRPESIIFFPKDQQPLTRKQIDWLNVFLMGYKYARIHSQTEFDGDDDENRGNYCGIYDLGVPRVQEQITLDIIVGSLASHRPTKCTGT